MVLLKEKREAAGMSISELSKRCGISRQRIYDIENNPETNLTANSILKFAEALQIDPRELIFFD